MPYKSKDGRSLVHACRRLHICCFARAGRGESTPRRDVYHRHLCGVSLHTASGTPTVTHRSNSLSRLHICVSKHWLLPLPLPPRLLLRVWQPVLLSDLDGVRSDHNQRSIKGSLRLRPSSQAYKIKQRVSTNPLKISLQKAQISHILLINAPYCIACEGACEYFMQSSLNILLIRIWLFSKCIPSADNSKKPQKRYSSWQIPKVTFAFNSKRAHVLVYKEFFFSSTLVKLILDKALWRTC